MYKYYLSIGSNLENKKDNLMKCIELLKSNNFNILKYSPLYINPPLLKENSLESDYHIFYNMVLYVEAPYSNDEILSAIKSIEKKMGRNQNKHQWKPRLIDIDIIDSLDQDKVSNELLNIPHKSALERSFVLDPLSHIDSTVKINGNSILEISRKKKCRIPAIMGILNLNSDSFTGDGMLESSTSEIEKKIHSWIDNGVYIIDIGPESTRPGATAISSEEEISRLQKIFPIIKNLSSIKHVKFSIDTYKYETAKECIKHGFNIINDVKGFQDERFFELIQDNDIEAVVMHSLVVPSDLSVRLEVDSDVIEYLNKWFDKVIEKFISKNIHLSRLILDPGIGFGMTPCQFIKVVKNFDKILKNDVRVLAGHSKKRYFNYFFNHVSDNSLFETIAMTIALGKNGADIIRLHDPIDHINALVTYNMSIKDI